MDARWFKEDRAQYKGDELRQEIEKSKKVLKGSTLITRRLKDILNTEIEATYKLEEDFDNPAWERNVIAAASKRKTLRQIINLLPSTKD